MRKIKSYKGLINQIYQAKEAGTSFGKFAFIVGVHPQTISRIINKKIIPTSSNLINFQIALSCNLEDLVEFEEAISIDGFK